MRTTPERNVLISKTPIKPPKMLLLLQSAGSHRQPPKRSPSTQDGPGGTKTVLNWLNVRIPAKPDNRPDMVKHTTLTDLTRTPCANAALDAHRWQTPVPELGAGQKNLNDNSNNKCPHRNHTEVARLKRSLMMSSLPLSVSYTCNLSVVCT